MQMVNSSSKEQDVCSSNLVRLGGAAGHFATACARGNSKLNWSQVSAALYVQCVRTRSQTPGPSASVAGPSDCCKRLTTIASHPILRDPLFPQCASPGTVRPTPFQVPVVCLFPGLPSLTACPPSRNLSRLLYTTPIVGRVAKTCSRRSLSVTGHHESFVFRPLRTSPQPFSESLSPPVLD